MTIEKKENLIRKEKELERLIFSEHLNNLYGEIAENKISLENLKELHNFISSAKMHSIGENKPNKYFSTAEAFNFVMSSLSSSEAIINGFDKSIDDLISIINQLHELEVTEEKKAKLMEFIKNLSGNISKKDFSNNERNYFEW